MFEYVSLSISTVLIPVWWIWDVLCWGDRLTAGFADVLRHSPLFGKGHSQAQFPFQLSGRRRGRGWWQKIYSSGFIIRVECIIISRRVCRFPTIECTDIHGWRWDGRRIRRVWWLEAVSIVVVILRVIYHCHGCQDVERVGRQVQVVQARRNDWELPSKTIRHCWLIWIVINSNYLRLGRCYRRHWGHPCCMLLRYLGWVEDISSVVSLWAGFSWTLFHVEHVRVIRGHRNNWHGCTDQEK